MELDYACKFFETKSGRCKNCNYNLVDHRLLSKVMEMTKLNKDLIIKIQSYMVDKTIDRAYCLGDKYSEIAIVSSWDEAESLLSDFKRGCFDKIQLSEDSLLKVLKWVSEWEIRVYPIIELATKDSILEPIMSGKVNQNGRHYLIGFKLASSLDEIFLSENPYQVKFGYAYERIN